MDMYFACLTKTADKVWNANARDHHGAWQYRTSEMMKAAKCFFVDLDVGEKPDQHKDRKAALDGLLAFLKVSGLPMPTLVSSGVGLHAYWPLTEALEAADWQPVAQKLKALFIHFGLLFDHGKVADLTTVLRVPGTWHLKDPINKRPVTLRHEGAVNDTSSLVALIDDSYVKAGLTVAIPTSHALVVQMKDNPFGESNIADRDFGPPVSARALYDSCAAIRDMVKDPENVSQPAWYKGLLNTARFCEDGRAVAHAFSANYSKYSFSATERKLDQLEPYGPATCATIQDEYGIDHCEGCPFRDRGSSPLVRARQRETAPSPVVTVETVAFATDGDDDTDTTSTTTLTIPEPPYPFKRLKSGGIGMEIAGKDGDDVVTVIYENDLYPIDIINNETDKTQHTMWRVHLPKREPRDFAVPLTSLYNVTLTDYLANAGVAPVSNNIPEMRTFMSAYIAKLQREMEDSEQQSHLGWNKTHDEFVLPDGVITRTGKRPALLTTTAANAAAEIHRAGTLEGQVGIMGFYNHPDYIAHQLLIGASLGSILFYMTNPTLGGGLLNVHGDSGASKSTALFTAASLWGDPTLLPLNGTRDGSTIMFRNNRPFIFSNLPVCVDEITDMPDEEIRNLALAVSQKVPKGRLDQKGNERKAFESTKAMIMIATANKSLHDILAQGNYAGGNAGSMRVFEMYIKKLHVHTPSQADNYLTELCRNYGHIGPKFLEHVVPNVEEVLKRVDSRKVAIQNLGGEAAERVWVGMIAASTEALAIANERGLLPFDAEAVCNWAVNTHLPLMRGTVSANTVSPEQFLCEYILQIANDTLSLRDDGPGQAPSMFISPRGAIKARYDSRSQKIEIAIGPMRDAIVRRGLVATQIMGHLRSFGIGVEAKTTLSRGVSKYAMAQTRNLVVDLAHPALAHQIKDVQGGLQPEYDPNMEGQENDDGQFE